MVFGEIDCNDSTMAPTETPVPRRRGRPASGRTVTGHSQSLARGLALLERLAEAERGLTLTDIAQQVGLPAATTHRLLNTLEQRHFVHQDEELGLWRVGVKSFTVGNTFLNGRDVVASTRPFLHQLMEQAGETANLAIVDEGMAVFLAQVESREMMRMIVRLGSRAPLHASGVGKALLAAMPATAIGTVLHRHGLPRITTNTITAPDKLHAALAAIRERGFAIDDEEHALGLRCVAATLHDEQAQPRAAISLSGPTVRLPDDRMAELGVLITRAAAAITVSLGGRMPQWHPRGNALTPDLA